MKGVKREQFRRLVRSIAVMIILVLESFIFYYVWNKYYSRGLWIEPFYAKGNIFIVLVYAAFMLLFLYIYGGFKIGYIKRGNLIYSQALSGLCANVIMYLQIVLLYRRLPDVRPLLAMTLADLLVIGICSYFFDKLFSYIFPPRDILLIYGEYPVEKLGGKIATRKDKFRIKERISVDEDFETIQKKILEYENGGVLLGDIHSSDRNQILKFCYAHSIRVYLTPKVSDIIVRNGETLHLFDTPLLLCRNYGLNIGQRFAKRTLDLVVSVLMFIVASPFMLVTAIVIKAYDKGPVLFKQKRLTIDGKEFYVYKFRSMIVDAEKDGVARLAKAGDSRITPVGKVIRATRLDELPQLLNIIKGDMSLVGPRPERPEIAKEYEKEIPEFAFRLKVKAGLTGYAQIYGKYTTTAYDKLKLDMMYIESYSFINDLKLILSTFKIMFMKESTEGMEGEETIALSHQSEKEKKND